MQWPFGCGHAEVAVVDFLVVLAAAGQWREVHLAVVDEAASVPLRACVSDNVAVSTDAPSNLGAFGLCSDHPVASGTKYLAGVRFRGAYRLMSAHVAVIRNVIVMARARRGEVHLASVVHEATCMPISIYLGARALAPLLCGGIAFGLGCDLAVRRAAKRSRLIEGANRRRERVYTLLSAHCHGNGEEAQQENSTHP